MAALTAEAGEAHLSATAAGVPAYHREPEED
jgi:hypothetical protein